MMRNRKGTYRMQPYKGKEKSAKTCPWVYIVGTIAVLSMTCLTSAQNQTAGANLVASLPLPTGKFPVGVRYFEWFDDSRKIFPNRSRVISVLIFYPSETRSGKHAEYFRGASQLPLNEQTASLRDEFGAAWKSVADGQLRSEALENTPIIRTKTKVPVILFSPALGVPSSAYSVQLTDLASHGYIVVATDHVNDAPLLVLSDSTRV
ncbi:MAG: hypothetical protein JO356_19535, partial [Acidobacteria bacterium]|nr:hypothetical protein [Acidobacteriota bacterium]